MIIIGAGHEPLVPHGHELSRHHQHAGDVRLRRPVGRRLVALCRPGEAAAANRLGAAGLRARLGPPAAPAELDLGLLCAHRPVALRDARRSARSCRRPRRRDRGTARSSTTTSAPSAWAGCRRRRSSKTNPLRGREGRRGRRHGAEGLCRRGAEVGRAEAVLRGPGQSEELAAQPVRLALQPARLVRQGPRIFPQASARHHAWRAWARISARTARQKPTEVVWHDEAPEGKLDLLVTLDFRMSTTCVYSDIVLPTATWYEKNDLNTSDMHPFIHPLTGAVDPVWEARSDWEIYKGIAKAFSQGCAGSARRREGRRADADHARHRRRDRAALRRQGLEDGRDASRSPARPCRRSRWSSATIRNLYKRFTVARAADGQARQRRQGHGLEHRARGRAPQGAQRRRHATRAPTKGLAHDRDRYRRRRSDPDAGAGDQRRGRGQGLGMRSAKFTGREHTHLALPKEDEKIRFRDVVAQPRKIISSPIWSGLEIGEGLLQRRLHQRARADPVAHADRPPAALSGSSVDARLRRGLLRLSPADRHSRRSSR